MACGTQAHGQMCSSIHAADRLSPFVDPVTVGDVTIGSIQSLREASQTSLSYDDWVQLRQLTEQESRFQFLAGNVQRLKELTPILRFLLRDEALGNLGRGKFSEMRSRQRYLGTHLSRLWQLTQEEQYLDEALRLLAVDEAQLVAIRSGKPIMVQNGQLGEKARLALARGLETDLIEDWGGELYVFQRLLRGGDENSASRVRDYIDALESEQARRWMAISRASENADDLGLDLTMGQLFEGGILPRLVEITRVAYQIELAAFTLGEFYDTSEVLAKVTRDYQVLGTCVSKELEELPALLLKENQRLKLMRVSGPK